MRTHSREGLALQRHAGSLSHQLCVWLLFYSYHPYPSGTCFPIMFRPLVILGSFKSLVR